MNPSNFLRTKTTGPFVPIQSVIEDESLWTYVTLAVYLISIYFLSLVQTEEHSLGPYKGLKG